MQAQEINPLLYIVYEKNLEIEMISSQNGFLASDSYNQRWSSPSTLLHITKYCTYILAVCVLMTTSWSENMGHSSLASRKTYLPLVTRETPKNPVLKPFFYGLYRYGTVRNDCTRTVDWSGPLEFVMVGLECTHYTPSIFILQFVMILYQNLRLSNIYKVILYVIEGLVWYMSDSYPNIRMHQ
jgi:hypothetical protein